MRPSPSSAGLRENRLLARGGYLGDVGRTYFEEPWRNGGTLGKVTGPVVGAASLFFEGIDQAISAATGRDYEPPRGAMGRTMRDSRAAISHLFKGEFLKSASALWSIISGDIIMDGADLVGGYRRGTRARLAAL